ncbi:MAG: LamG domain-containing protein, partial [Kiloniellales bacterium]|nr:LamG domain-containing protein [Kiloniellales bacterium]
ETIAFKVSSASAEPYEARLVRVICGDPNPAGPGILEEPVSSAFEGRYPSRAQTLHLGSYARVPVGDGLGALTSFTLLATIWPTLPDKGEQAVISHGGGAAGRGFALTIDPEQGATLRLGREGGEDPRISVGRPLRQRVWYRIWASLDTETGRVCVGQTALDGPWAQDDSGLATASLDGPVALDAGGDLLIAGLVGDPVTGHFNGKIEAPTIYDRALIADEVPGAATGEIGVGLLARWDFSQAIPSTRIIDVGPQGLHGELVNLPARAMTGSTWNGREMCWRHAPEDYGAIHFHDDDIYDAGWETDFTFTVPDELPSGIYAARLRCGEHQDTMPFVVCPPKGRRRADLCVIIPTITYAIYGNHARPDFSEAWTRRATEWPAYPWNPAQHREYGLSTYNVHNDGSGICHAAHLRPLMTVKQGYFTFPAEIGSGLRHYQADTHLIAWLESKAIAYDLMTDLELHREGAAALGGYRCVLTASHPEYHTAETLDALTAYRDGGGRLGYLGGNGFYWRVALHSELPGAIEIRRGEGGIRAWAAEPGEYYNAFDGNYGGLWRRNARPPQLLAGVGFSAQGKFNGSYYRRTSDARDSRVSWIFEGITDERLGDFGLSGGGAAGYELDRADPRLGTPAHTLVVARSEGHGEDFVLVPEEQLTHITTWPGEPPEVLIRADMAFFETPRGGAVFSVGSITFCGSLMHAGGDNNISRLLENVVRRFLEPRPFEMPDAS